MRATEILFESRAAVLKAEAEAKLLDKQIELERLRLDAALVRAQALDEAAAVCDEAVMFHEAAAGSELAGELAAAIRALKSGSKNV